jgi:hypothetical protein
MSPSLSQFLAMNHYTPYYGDRQRQMTPFCVCVRVPLSKSMSDSVSYLVSVFIKGGGTW